MCLELKLIYVKCSKLQFQNYKRVNTNMFKMYDIQVSIEVTLKYLGYQYIKQYTLNISQTMGTIMKVHFKFKFKSAYSWVLEVKKWILNDNL